MTTTPTIAESAYELSGIFLEACDCLTLCPCWVGQPPDQDMCNGLFAWRIDTGQIDNIALQGCRVVSVSHHEGNRADTNEQLVAIFIDDSDRNASPTRLTETQLRRVAEVFTGTRGGPLAGLGNLLGRVVNLPAGAGVAEAIRRDIRIDDRDGGGLDVEVSRPGEPVSVDVTSAPVIGETGTPIELHESSLARSLGTPATVGRAERLSLLVPDFAPDHWLDLDLRARSATRGRFHYVTT